MVTTAYPLLRPLAGTAALTLLATSVAAREVPTEDLPLDPRTDGVLVDEIIFSVPGHDWNCLDIEVAGAPLRVIIPSYERVEATPEEIRERTRRLAKLLLPATVFASSGTVAGYYESGELFGVELDVFPTNTVPPPSFAAGECLPIDARILGPDGAGGQEYRGNLFCYKATQWAARIELLTDLGDGAPSQHRMWIGPVCHSSSSVARSTWIGGGSNTVYGDVKSNGGLRVSGSGHVVPYWNDYATMCSVLGDDLEMGPLAKLPAAAASAPPHAALWYSANADHFFAGDVFLTAGPAGEAVTGQGQPVAGLVYASGGIFVEGNAITASLTLVAQGPVVINGTACDIEAAVDAMLAWSVGDDVSFEGSDNALQGSVFAWGEMAVPGSGNVLVGCLRGDQVRVGGQHNLISDGTRF